MIKIKPFLKKNPRGIAKISSEPNSDLVQFYLNNASFYEEEKLARTYDIEHQNSWCGFFSIANYSLTLDKQGKGVREVIERKGIPRVPPAILLAQLFICSSNQRQGLGKKVLRHIVKLGLQSKSGCRLIVVDLDNDGVREFYSKHGWISGPQTSGKMFLDLLLFKKIQKVLSKKLPNLSTEDELQEFAKTQASLSQQTALF